MNGLAERLRREASKNNNATLFEAADTIERLEKDNARWVARILKLERRIGEAYKALAQ